MTQIYQRAFLAITTASLALNPTAELRRSGQAIWLDFIDRGFIASGELARLVREDGLSGVTSNPAIFNKAIVESETYLDAVAAVCRRHRKFTPKQVYEQLAVEDIRAAADVLRPVYDKTGQADGYACLEVAPDLAHETAQTIDEARRLWRRVNRHNVMIKVPGTAEGLPAIRELLTQGINVNITLLFARDRYEEVARTYIEALEARRRANQRIGHVASVASFFVSRIDTAVDAILTEKLRTATETEQPELERLLGEAAIASARLAYGTFNEIFSGPRWSALAADGARVQRVLWASTSVKNPVYHDVRYVEELIGSDTVNTMTLHTLDAFRQHGHVRPSLDEGLGDAAETLVELEQMGVSMSAVTTRLLEDGVDKFIRPYNALLSTLERRCHDLRSHAGWRSWLRGLWSHR